MTNGFRRLLSGLMVIAVLHPSVSLAVNSEKNRSSAVATTEVSAAVSTFAGSEWTNRETGITVQIPDGWQGYDAARPTLLNEHSSLAVLLGCDTDLPPGTSMAQFQDHAYKKLPGWTIRPFQPTFDPNIMRTAGRDESNRPVVVVISIIGDRFCRIFYTSSVASINNTIDDPVLTAALLKSAGGDPPTVPQDPDIPGTESKSWTNPRTGQLLALPGNWVAHIGGVGPLQNISFTDYSRKIVLTYTLSYGGIGETVEEAVAAIPKLYPYIKWDTPFAAADAAWAKGVWLASGFDETGAWTSLHVKQVGEKRLGMAFLIDASGKENSGATPLEAPDLLPLLFASDEGHAVADKAPPSAPVAATHWANPRTGKVVTLPAGWLFKGIGEQSSQVFSNDDEYLGLAYLFIPGSLGMDMEQLVTAAANINKLRGEYPLTVDKETGLEGIWRTVTVVDGLLVNTYYKDVGTGIAMLRYQGLDALDIEVIESPLTPLLLESEAP